MLRLNGHGRREGPFRPPPIDPFQQHRQLCACERHRSALRLRPHKAPAFQPLREQTKPIAVEPQHLDLITAPSAKNKHVAGIGLRVEHRLHLSAQTIKAPPHVGHACGDPDLRACARIDHERRHSNAARNNAASTPLSTRIFARPGSSIWMTLAGIAAIVLMELFSATAAFTAAPLASAGERTTGNSAAVFLALGSNLPFR